MRSRFSFALLAAAAGLAAVAPAPTMTAHALQPARPTLVTHGQAQAEAAAIALLRDPAIVAARDTVIAQWSKLPQAQTPDGRETLNAAVDELVYFSVLGAVERRQFAPAILWTLSAPRQHGGTAVPGSRFGIDSPDRIYRTASVDPSHRYVIRGQRSATPSNGDFLFEVTGKDLKTIGSLSASKIDVDAAGRFTVTVDSSTGKARNHLTLPPGATGLLIRDTLSDWSTQVPNQLSIEVDGARPQPATPDQVKAEALALIGVYSNFNGWLLGQVAKAPVNQVTPHVRGLSSGVEGAIISTNPFKVGDDEALVITLDKQDARYVGFQLTDVWARSLPYWDTTGSLSDKQVSANTDGTVTYVIAPSDPGYRNWVSTNGHNEGFLAIRVEDFKAVDPARLVRSAKVVKLAALGGAVPAGAPKVTAAERAEQLADRKAGYERRITN